MDQAINSHKHFKDNGPIVSSQYAHICTAFPYQVSAKTLGTFMRCNRMQRLIKTCTVRFNLYVIILAIYLNNNLLI